MMRLLRFCLVFLFAASGAAAQPLISIYSIRSPNSQNDGYFGSSFESSADLDGDGVRDLIVGAPDESGGRGRVYLFSGATGALLRTIPSPVDVGGVFFGVSVADVGDVDGDGTPDIVASGYFAVGGQASAGRAYVFSGASGTTLLTLESPASQASGFFGFNVAGPGDLDGDGTPDIVVGAGDEDVLVGGNTVVDHGAVYAFSGADGSLLWRSTPETQEANLYYGRAVSAGDITGDGVNEILTSAVLADNNDGIESGLAYVVDGASGAFVYTLQPGPNAQANGFFGNTLAGLSDLDGDGVPELAVGAPYEGVGGTSVRDGSVSFYRGSDGSLIGTYVREERQAERGFGWEIQDVGDFDGDGISDIGISAVRQFNRFQHRPPPLTLPFSGAVFITSGAEIGQATTDEIAEIYPTLPNFPTTFSWRYGEDFASLGDIDGDGLPDLAIGAPTQGANIGFIGVIPGSRILAISDVDVQAEEEEPVVSDGTYDFDATAVDLALDGVAISKSGMASGDPAGLLPSAEHGGREAGGEAPEADGLVFFARGASGTASTVRVQRFDTAPTDVSGIAEANVSAYRWIVATEGPLRWDPTSEIRFSLAELPSSGITDPTDVTVYLRETLASGDFTALATSYDAGTGEIVALLPRANGSFAGEFALASDSNPLPTEGVPAGGLALDAFPNPSRGAVTVSLRLAAPEAASVAAFDALGRRVATLHEGPLAAGEHAFTLDPEAASLRSGVYVVRATAGAGAVSRRITVLR